ncbi:MULTISPECIES: protoporphyrinogen oxidase [Pseudanabaena]|jgi:protoporphyrinogen/coproporphyrinogen III oxidase|uniref:protoporphyrinogen oxidase n=1 Tax=Pseudanabaena TaxID=1152 RepID=UPI0024793115|nr:MULTISPECIES: protoporphyrinogen oxidase [Pseudanabaena]MEA5487864.1 protoporphyrinogen oxidase [Pseudanabaena sp. CCNP1317]WGS74399.1 protoporphyrinogen oxidase [Pseudanabaena galeata CCNP1313]
MSLTPSSETNQPLDVLVVGAGISGLTIAHELAIAKKYRVLVAEAQDRVGGAITSAKNDEGYQWEEGPNSFQPAPELLRLAVQVGLKDELVLANGKLPRFVFLNGKLNALPMSPPTAIASKILTWGGKIRLALGAIGFARPAMAGEESVDQFFSRLLGKQAVERLVAPFISGVYAGDPKRLSAKAAFAKIFRLENSYNGLLAGAILSAKERKAQKLNDPNLPKVKAGELGSFRQGIQTLPEAIATKLREQGTAVKQQWTLRSLEKQGEIYISKFDTPIGEETVRSRSVVLSTPAYVTAKLLQDYLPAASQALNEIFYPTVACVVLAYPKSEFAYDMKGFGNLIPRTQGVRTLGTIWSSSLFAGRAPEGWQLLLNFIGGTLDPALAKLSEPEIIAAVHQDLKKTILRPDTKAEPKAIAVHVWDKAIPQYELGHLDRLATVEKELQKSQGLYISANFIGGVALGDCIKRSLQEATKIDAFLK